MFSALLAHAHCRGLVLFLILRLDFESRGHAKGTPGVVGVRGAVRVHTAEVAAGVVIRRPPPPIGRRTRGRMLVLHLRTCLASI